MPERSPLALDPSADEVRRWSSTAIEWIAQYLESVRHRRVYPQTTANEIRQALDHALPDQGTSFEELIHTFEHAIVASSRHNAHPRMFGYVQSPGTMIGSVADLLASVLNTNLTAWRSAPAAVEIERLTIEWIKQILGFTGNAAGLFVSGGSMANLAALATARRSKADTNFALEGVQAITPRMRVYASGETHHSISKTAALLGIGKENVRTIGVDDQFKISIEGLVGQIKADIDSGYEPFCVVANAGTVNTGACDPLQSVREIATEFDLWMHVDASYGGFAALARSVRHVFDGIDQADSVALDPHKWLYLPLDCGCVIYRDGEAARETFAHEADYTRVLGHQADEAFAFWDYGPELSRRFRALKVWMLLKGVGLRCLGEAIENDLTCARYFESMVADSEDFEMLAPVELSIFCFRYLPPALKRKLAEADQAEQCRVEEKLNGINERLLLELQRDGNSYLSNTMIRGQFALRGCVMNYRTSKRDMEILLHDLRRCAALLEEPYD